LAATVEPKSPRDHPESFMNIRATTPTLYLPSIASTFIIARKIAGSTQSRRHWMEKGSSYHGSCFCGAVQFTVTGEPAVMGYCHCDSCRRWSASPVNAFTLWKPDTVRITQGADKVGTYSKTERSNRKWCKSCGGHVFTEHPGWGVIDVYAAAIPEFRFKAAVHVNYQETVLRMNDGLPKLKDYPKEMGGSGVAIPE
jgi:hypothetical protein